MLLIFRIWLAKQELILICIDLTITIYADSIKEILMEKYTYNK